MSRKTPGEVRVRTCGTKSPCRSEALRFIDSSKSPSTKIDGSLVNFRWRLSNRHGRPRRMLIWTFEGNTDQTVSTSTCYYRLGGAWRDRDTNDIFAHCSLISYFLDFKFSNFICLSELNSLIWFFFKNSFRKKRNIRKTTQNALAPNIFIVLSIALKLGTPLLHTQAQNTLLQNFKFRSCS